MQDEQIACLSTNRYQVLKVQHLLWDIHDNIYRLLKIGSDAHWHANAS